MNRTKEYRRKQFIRIKNKWRKRSRLRYWRYLIGDEKTMGKIASAPKPLNCQCCCSPRYSILCSEEEKLTVAERKINQSFESQIQDLNVKGDDIEEF